MAPSSLRKAIGAVKDQTSISLAKVNNSTSISDLDVAIVKATRHDEHPAEDKYIREIISLTSYSRAFINFCVNTLSRRLNKTKNWTVALKTLILIQRLLAEGDPAYEQEIFFATRRGTRLLNMSDFRDSKSTSWEYSAFVRTYSLYLDDRLEFRMQGKRGKRSAYVTENLDEEGNPAPSGKATPVHEMKTDRIFTRIQHLLQLLERFLACRPAGLAKHNRVVIVALYPIVKDSFHMYYDVTEILGILIDRFMELEIPDSVKVYEIFVRVSKQFDELDKFYDWCKTVGIARTSEYPEVEMITQKKLELMDDFIRDKSALAQNTRLRNTEPYEVEEEPVQEPEPEPVEEDMNAMKALPAPEPPVGEPKEEEEPKKEETLMIVQKEADLLNLGDDITSEQHGNNLALALFDMGQPGPTSTGPTITWEAFKDDTTDWETALIQSTSNLAVTNAQANVSLPGGFDMLVLDGMYHQGATNAAMNATAASGSASSVAFGSAGRPGSQMLALPAPPQSGDGNNGANGAAFVDPFASSLVVAPPAYVQMSDMEKKQRLLMEEQMGWQQYARDGMQGQIGFSKLQQQYYNYTAGGYAPRY